MRYLWIYLVAVLGVARGHLNESTATSHSEPVETTTPYSEDHNDTHQPYNATDLKDEDLRRYKPKDIWMWDLYCHLQRSKGPCKKQLKRYYYNAQLDLCETFTYSGCTGNQNNFETAVECERRCKGANFLGVNERSLPTVCYLQPDSGMCLTFNMNYYYDLDMQQCKEFTYGGCGGNLNRFESKSACNEYCSFKTFKS